MTHPVVYRKPHDPYMGTETPFEKSLTAIERMLERYQVEDLITRKTYQVLQGSGIPEPVTFYTLAFRKAGFNYLVEFPIIIEQGPKLGKRLRMDVSARIIHDRIKALLIGVDLELMNFNVAMMPYTALPDGKGGLQSLQDFVIEHRAEISQGRLDLAMLPAHGGR